MRATKKLNKANLDDLQPGEHDYVVWDGELEGFGVKATPKGRKGFIVQHRPKGHKGAAK